MEPISMITGALVAGATAAGKDVAKKAVTDGYAGLKALIQKRFKKKNKPEGEVALAQHEKDPKVWEAPLKDSLEKAEADKDSEILEAAQKLLELVKPEKAAAGKFVTQAENIQSVVNAEKIDTLTQNFGTKPEK